MPRSKVARDVSDARSEKFCHDIKGDPDNLTYGRLSRSAISRYARLGKGRILGFHTAGRIDNSLSNDAQIVVNDSRRSAHHAERSIFHEELMIIDDMPNVLETIKPTAMPVGENFVPLTSAMVASDSKEEVSHSPTLLVSHGVLLSADVQDIDG